MTWSGSPDAFSPEAMKVTRVLGDLEADVMAVLWEAKKPLAVRTVRDRLAGAGRDLAYNTVATVLVRLTAKGLVRREKRERIWHYRATLEEAEFQARVSGQVLRELLDLAPEATLSQLVDVLTEDEPEALDELARLIEARRAQTNEGEEGA